MQTNQHHFLPENQRGAALPWALLLVALGAGLFVYLQYIMPMQKDLESARSLLYETRAANTNLDEQVDSLESLRDELEAAKSELASEVERKERELEEMKAMQEELAKKLEPEIQSGSIDISQKEGQLVVDVADRILFDSGEAQLNDQGKELLLKVAEILNKVDKVVQVGGHTDAVPISDRLKDQFASNWELASARATNVVRFLQDDGKVPGKKLVAAGFSQYRPVASNATNKGRRRNRRIELVLLEPPKKEKP